MPTPQATWDLATRHLAQRVQVFESLPSTNDLALLLTQDPAHEGLAILAREQTAGRGQYGRSWHAPPGSSVLLSVILFPPNQLRRPALLTAWAAVSVCDLIQEMIGLQAKIKWPNDVLLQGNKVCGILIEQRTVSGREADGGPRLATVVGIGLNVLQSAELFAQAELPLAGSLFSVTGKSLDSEQVARKLLGILDDHYDLLIQGNTSALESLWKWRLGLLGKVVAAELIQGTCHGRLQDVTFAGLELELATGEVVRLLPESVRHLELSDSLTTPPPSLL